MITLCGKYYYLMTDEEIDSQINFMSWTDE